MKILMYPLLLGRAAYVSMISVSFLFGQIGLLLWPGSHFVIWRRHLESCEGVCLALQWA